MLAHVVILILASAWHVYGERQATTRDGQEVLLSEDGTWRARTALLQDPPYDFRRVRWGMSSREVAQSESLEALGPEDRVSGKIGGLTVHVGHVFHSDELVGTVCRLADPHDENSDFSADFDSLKAALSRQYGLPDKDTANWWNDQFSDYPQFYGTAISLGHLEYNVQWETERTVVSLVMRGQTHMVRREISPQMTRFQPEYRREIVLDVLYEDSRSSARKAFRDLVYNWP
ncbi:MAG: hypothetical protein O3A47_05045 [Chloroflexi bacterium]|nr:hypothetical protein [Chloroflexota bacterium]